MKKFINALRFIGTQLNLSLSIEFGCGVANKRNSPKTIEASPIMADDATVIRT